MIKKRNGEKSALDRLEERLLERAWNALQEEDEDSAALLQQSVLEGATPNQISSRLEGLGLDPSRFRGYSAAARYLYKRYKEHQAAEAEMKHLLEQGEPFGVPV